MDISVDLPIDREAEEAALGILVVVFPSERKSLVRGISSDLFADICCAPIYEIVLSTIDAPLKATVDALRARSTDTLYLPGLFGRLIYRAPDVRQWRFYLSRLESCQQSRRNILRIIDELKTEVAHARSLDSAAGYSLTDQRSKVTPVKSTRVPRAPVRTWTADSGQVYTWPSSR